MEQYYYNTLTKPQQNSYNAIKAGLQSLAASFPVPRLTQKELAEFLHCDQSLYSKYEREERPLPLEFADKLADYYGVSVDYLIGRTSVKKPYPKNPSGK